MQLFELKTIERIGDEFCTLEEAKSNLRVTSNHDDLLINSQLMAAVTFAEEFLKKFIGRREVTAISNNFIGSEIYIPSEPLLNIVDLKIIIDEEEILLLDNRDFNLVGNKIIFKRSYFKKKVLIKYIAGYDIVPEIVRQGIFLHLSLLYDKQVISSEILDGILLMYKAYRKLRII